MKSAPCAMSGSRSSAASTPRRRKGNWTRPSAKASSVMAPDPPRSRRVQMAKSDLAKGTSFSAFRTAGEEAKMKREKSELKTGEQASDNEGGHMSSNAGRVVQRSGAGLPFVAVLAHQGGEATEHAFATMREAEAFIKRNTPVPNRTLSPLYDRPPRD